MIYGTRQYIIYTVIRLRTSKTLNISESPEKIKDHRFKYVAHHVATWDIGFWFGPYSKRYQQQGVIEKIINTLSTYS